MSNIDFPSPEEELLDETELDGEEATEGTSALYERYRVEADKGQEPMRVDKFLMEHIRGISRNRMQLAAEAGLIWVGEKAVKSNYKVKPHDVVTVMLNRPPREMDITAEDIPLDIVYEDEAVMVVNKPAGMVVHPGCGNYSGTLVNAIAWHLKDDPNYDPNDPDVGLAHRIDKDTSGLLVVAKTPAAKTSLCKQFFHKTTKRQYKALVWGHFDQTEGRIEGNIGRSPKDRLCMAFFDPTTDIGKPAVTHYKVVEPLAYVTLIECHLETGRTHQIRVHMQHLGHPLFADERYGGDQILRGVNTAKYQQFIRNCFKVCPRQALHAETLGFVHPTTGQELFFTAPVPEDMNELLDRWRNYVKNMD